MPGNDREGENEHACEIWSSDLAGESVTRRHVMSELPEQVARGRHVGRHTVAGTVLRRSPDHRDVENGGGEIQKLP